MNNREEFEVTCELLPEGVTWGEPITPSIAQSIAQAALASQAQQPTDISKQLREYAADSGYSHNDYADTMLAAASEIERYYGGMMAWKKTAETKDRKLSQEIESRISERYAARLAASQAQQEPAIAVELESVTSQIEDGYGLWMTCSGCHECGGLGAAWETFGNESLPPAPKGDVPTPFTDWAGGDCPVDSEIEVEYKMRGSDNVHVSKALLLEWRRDIIPRDWDIVAYRVPHV